jgi:chaperonin GroES
MNSGNIENKIVPLGNRVLVELLEQPFQTNSGLYLPESNQQNRQLGIVLNIGESDENMNLTIGDKIILNRYSGTEVKYDDRTYLSVVYSDILAKIIE